jgi:glycosyltransferase involved in cell wall biosynthesis
MRVGFFVGEIQKVTVGGGATFQTNILYQLIRTKSDHKFYIFYKSNDNLFDDSENIKFINLSKLKKRLFSKKDDKEISLNDQILELKIELVWFLTPHYEFVEAPFVLTIWDLQHRLQSYFPEVSLSGWDFNKREKFYSEYIPKASYVVIGNNQGAGEVEKFYNFPRERIKTIPLPTPQFVFEDLADDKILSKNNLVKGNYLLYPAQFWPHKNHIRIIKALDILKKQGIKWKVVFTGSDKGNKDYIEAKVKEYNLKDEVKFLGFVSKAELISLYKNAFATTFLSAFGPDNIPPLESMALGCPVICADAKGMKEQLGDAAIFFNPFNENELVEKIKELSGNDNIRAAMIENGKIVAQSVTTDKYIEKMISLIDEFSPIRECWSDQDRYIHP